MHNFISCGIIYIICSRIVLVQYFARVLFPCLNDSETAKTNWNITSPDVQAGILLDFSPFDLETTFHPLGASNPPPPAWLSDTRSSLPPHHFGPRSPRRGGPRSHSEESRRAALTQCTVCGAQVCKNNLPRHMRIHTRDRVYQCSLCSYNTSDSSNLKRHLLTVHAKPSSI